MSNNEEHIDLNHPHGHLKLKRNQLDYVLSALQWEQEQLQAMRIHHEDGKYPYIKTAIAVFSLFITGMIALFALSSKYQINIFNVTEYYLLFTIVIIGMCFINLGIIKYIIWKRAEGIKIVRQINCNRQAIDSVLYHGLLGEYPQKEECLQNEETLYWKILGKHRKLETNNDPLREGQEYYFKSLPLSPDNFMVLVITSFTFISLMLPIIFWMLYAKDESIWVAYVSGLISVLFLSVVVWHVSSSQKMIQKALQSKKDRKRSCGVESKK